MKRMRMTITVNYIEVDTPANSNPRVYGVFEDEAEIDKYIEEIELGNRGVLNKKALEILNSFFK